MRASSLHVGWELLICRDRDAREAKKAVSDLAHFYSRRWTLLPTKMLKNLQWKGAPMLGSPKANQIMKNSNKKEDSFQSRGQPAISMKGRK